MTYFASRKLFAAVSALFALASLYNITSTAPAERSGFLSIAPVERTVFQSGPVTAPAPAPSVGRS